MLPGDDGTFVHAVTGKIMDLWGNVWDPVTQKWYNSDGKQWYGTDPGTGVGIYGDPDSYIDTSGKVIGGGSGYEGGLS